MGAIIRQASAADSTAWLELLKSTLGSDYPDRQVYDPAWVKHQLAGLGGDETWVVESNGRLEASLSFLGPSLPNRNPIANLGRDLLRAEAWTNGSAKALLTKMMEMVTERRQLAIARVLASDNPRQILYEQLGFVCVGFQPCKHTLRAREGVLFYVCHTQPQKHARLPLSESLPQVSELAITVLNNLEMAPAPSVRDGATGYPLQAEVQFEETLFANYQQARDQAKSQNPPTEISGGGSLGWGWMRIVGGAPIRALLCRYGQRLGAGIAFAVDDRDRCMRIIDGFGTDDLSMGPVLNRAVKLAQEKYNAVYVEVDVLMTAPRFLKCAEQIGFVPVAYLPGFHFRDVGVTHVDVVKLVKLNLAYGPENATLTTHAKTITEIVDRTFHDQKAGVAIINLLRGLSIFEGLGDGELRKISRLFTQKLYRADERVFAKGDSGSEAYIVMRGQVDILLEEGAKPIASMGNGQILGELAFLDGAPRTALAVATQPSILLVVQREAFNDLAQREPHLGMVVMRNVALELSNRLRRTTAPPR